MQLMCQSSNQYPGEMQHCQRSVSLDPWHRARHHRQMTKRASRTIAGKLEVRNKLHSHLRLNRIALLLNRIATHTLVGNTIRKSSLSDCHSLENAIARELLHAFLAVPVVCRLEVVRLDAAHVVTIPVRTNSKASLNLILSQPSIGKIHSDDEERHTVQQRRVC